MLNDDEMALAVCNPIDAKELRKNTPEIEAALVITSVVEPGEIILVPMQEFIDYLHENGKKKNKHNQK